MAKPILNQVTVGATFGDAITDHALLIRRWLREWGFESEIYAGSFHPGLAKEVRPAVNYRPRAGERWVILHHSTGSPLVEWLLDLPVEFILVYHNITPPEFYAPVNPALAEEMREGRRQLHALRPRTALAVAVSEYNQLGLVAEGFPRTGILPISLDERRYDLPSKPELVERLEGSGPLLLFVGRQVPNKRPEDLIKLLYYYRRIEPAARLILLGDPWLPSYGQWLLELARDLGLGDVVLILGHVSQQELVTYYRLADLYVSMSEHEGFGKPLIESMYLGLPILAYAAAGVPYTLGGAGVLFHKKEYEALAELVHLLVTDNVLRERIVAGQRERVQDFLAPQVRRQLYEQVALLFGQEP
ncbi:MAG: glycosyltransferase [Ardenticatenaceae bacterium]